MTFLTLAILCAVLAFLSLRGVEDCGEFGQVLFGAAAVVLSIAGLGCFIYWIATL